MIKNNQSGQSTIEFIFAFCFGVSVIFMVFNQALSYCTGYLVHYATFMASRVYLTADNFTGFVTDPSSSIAGQTQDAIDTYAQYRLEIFKVGPDKFKVNEAVDGMDASEYLTVGARTMYEIPIDALGKVTGASMLELVSESFLGHEPTRAQCANRTCAGVTGTDSCEKSWDITLYDNGC